MRYVTSPRYSVFIGGTLYLPGTELELPDGIAEPLVRAGHVRYLVSVPVQEPKPVEVISAPTRKAVPAKKLKGKSLEELQLLAEDAHRGVLEVPKFGSVEEAVAFLSSEIP